MREFYTPASMEGQPYHIADETLRFKPTALQIVLPPGSTREGSVIVRGRDGDAVRGFLNCTGFRMQCVTERFEGNPDRIMWRYDASSLKEGEKESGFLRFFTNHGEYRVPFEVSVEAAGSPSSGMQELRAGAQDEHWFAALAARDWEGAVRRFYERGFGSSLRSGEEKLLWRGLCVYPGNEQNVEEFLIAACGKKAVRYEADCREIRAEVPWEYVRQEREGALRDLRLRIRREGWGFTQLDVRFCGDFFTKEGVRLTREDFYGDICELRIPADLRGLHAGRNFGRILLTCPYEEISLPVEIYCRNSPRTRRQGSMHALQTALTQTYEKLRIGTVSEEEWVRQVQEILRRMSSLDRNGTLPGLYYAHLMLMQGRVHAAIMELEAVRRKLAGVRPGEVLEMGYTQFSGESDVLFSYRLFLTAAAYRDEEVMTPRIVRILRDRYRRNPGEWRIAWMLLQLSGEYAPRTEGRWLFLQKQFVNGSRSPVLYLEAWEMVLQDPTVLNLQRERQSGRFDGDAFEQHLLLYALRNGLLTESVMRQVMEMTGRRRQFSGILYRVMAGAYEMDSLREIRQEILQTICSMLIRSGMTGPSYFPWFSRAVERGLPVTRLADSYLQSLPEDCGGVIPDSVVQGASRTVSLPMHARIFFYRYLYENRRRFRDIYEENLPGITACLRMQIDRGEITQDLAVLYRACLSDPELGLQGSVEARLSQLSYFSILRTTRTPLKRVFLIQAQETGEKAFRLENGCCIMPVIGEDNCILFEDDAGGRYAVSVPYTLDRVMEPVRIQGESDFAMEIAEAGDGELAVTARSAAYCEELLSSEKTAPEFRLRLVMGLMRYYAGQDRQKLHRLAKEADPASFERKEQAEVTGFLAEAGLYEQGLRWLSACGLSYVPAQRAARITVGAFRQAEQEGGKTPADGRLLQELSRQLSTAPLPQELSAGLLAILLAGGELFVREQEYFREKAAAQGVSIPETGDDALLRQILFTGEITEKQPERILRALRSTGDAAKTGKQALEQYLCACFAGKCSPSPEILDYLLQKKAAGEPIPDLGALVLLQNSPAGQEEVLQEIMEELAGRGIVFPFFRDLPFGQETLAFCRNETMIEYHDPYGNVRPSGHTVIHYAHERGGRQEPFRAREMKEMVRGFYVSSFFLFFGEQLHYFITDDAQEKNIAESGTIGRDLRICAEGEGRFELLDALTELAAGKKREEAFEAFAAYRETKALTEEIFGKDL